MSIWKKLQRHGSTDAHVKEKLGTVIELIKQYRYIEQSVKIATDELEEKARQLADRKRLATISYDCEAGYCLAESKVEKNSLIQEKSVSESRAVVVRKYRLDLPSVRYRVDLARRLRLPPNIFARPVENVVTAGTSDADLKELEELDARVSLWRYNLRSLEERILDLTPSDVDNAMQKIKFLTELIMNSDDLDIDYFAYLIEECVEVCDGELDEMLKTYRKHFEGF